MEFCPVCMLRTGLPGGVESRESSASEDTLNPRSEQAVRRFEHYELLTGEDGKPVELGRGAMGVTYKALDINLRCAVALKVINVRFIGAVGRKSRCGISIAPPLKQLKGVPPQVTMVLKALLDKDPKGRFQTPAELLKTLSTVTNELEKPAEHKQESRTSPGSKGQLSTNKVSSSKGARTQCRSTSIRKSERQ